MKMLLWHVQTTGNSTSVPSDILMATTATPALPFFQCAVCPGGGSGGCQNSFGFCIEFIGTLCPPGFTQCTPSPTTLAPTAAPGVPSTNYKEICETEWNRREYHSLVILLDTLLTLYSFILQGTMYTTALDLSNVSHCRNKPPIEFPK